MRICIHSWRSAHTTPIKGSVYSLFLPLLRSNTKFRKSCCFSEIFYTGNFQIFLHLMQRLEKLRYTLVPFAWSQNFIPTLEIYSNTHLVELLNRIIHHNLLNFQFRDSTRNSFYQITIKCFDNLKDIWYGGTINIFQI